MHIQVLAAEVVAQIAAGEVVERPASVVKELVENSLDAGATRITVEVRGGGVNLIRATDNGSGIAAAEAELAWQRYATNKISTLGDLERITSLGFRGEALPSIAAVAQVDLLSRTKEDTTGVYLSLRDGKVVEKARRGAPAGTIITVRHLFRQIPARLKFLKSPATENNHIVNLMHQFSLAFPEVRFQLIVEGRFSLRTSGNGNLREVIAQVYGVEVAEAMREISQEAFPLAPQVSGYVSPPSLSRSSRHYAFFVNHRGVHSGLLCRAVEEAYQGLLVGRFPLAVINLSLPPTEVDVNVHPSKREVKFRQEQKVFAAVRQAVEQTLTKAPLPQIKLPSASPPSQEQVWWMPPSSTPEKAPSLLNEPFARANLPLLRVLGQLANAYIIAEGPDGLYLIDQHAAHERVLFEKILAQRAQRNIEVQGLLEPLTVELTARQEELWESKKENLSSFGFTLEPFGNRTYLIRAIPALLPREKVTEIIREMVDSLGEEQTAAQWEKKVAVSLACHSAVRAGQVLAPEEMRGLVQQLEQATSPRTCPHGRPTMVHLSSGQLEKEFGRT